MHALIKNDFAALFALAATLTLAHPTAAAEVQQDPVKIMAAVKAATGGAAWDQIHSLHTRAKVQSHDRSGNYETWEDVLTGRSEKEQALPPHTSAGGRDGISTWIKSETGVAYILRDPDTVLGAANDLYLTARAYWYPDRQAGSMQSLGTKTESGRVFDLVSITPAGGRPVVIWVDHQTHLIDRTVEQEAEQVDVIQYEDYRQVSGVRLPFRILHGEVDKPSQIDTIDTIEINPEIPDRRFSLPDAPPPAEIAGGQTSVTVPFMLNNNEIVLKVMLNGKPYEAFFDTGGSLVIPPAAMQDGGFATAGSGEEHGGGEGSVAVKMGAVESLDVGGALIRNPTFASFTWDEEHPKRLIIGQETLQHFVVRIDFDAMTMTLTKPEAFKYAGAGVALPFHFQSNQPEVYGAVDGIAGVFCIDTGDNGSLLLIAPFARRYRLAERYHATIPYGGVAVSATHGVLARAGEVELEGADGRPVASVTGPITRISQQERGFDADRYVSGNIGIGILKQYNLTFDYSHQVIFLEKNKGYGAPDPFSRSGLRIEKAKDGWRVNAVYAGGPGEALGIKANDIITQINGNAAAAVDSAAVHDLFIQPMGTRVELEIRSGNETRSVTLILKDVL
jgi:hypothetical protein